MVYRSLLRPILFRLPPETAHDLALRTLPFFLASGIIKKDSGWSLGKLKRFGLEFENPIGLAAGFDKNGVAADSLARLGFGFIEAGTVTNHSQPGNPKPRLFRLPEDRALINRLGFNNCGAAQLAVNIRAHRPECVIGVNLGKSRSVPLSDAAQDYLASLDAVYEVADYIAINVSSPNTPNLRELQQPNLLAELLSALQERNMTLAKAQSLPQSKPLLIKIAPDLSEKEIEAIIDVALNMKISGIIATNTTVSREGLVTPTGRVQACGEGGLSGSPLQEKSNQVIAFIYRATRGRLPIIGVGGVFTAADAWTKICAGASLVQLYTGFIYEGPAVVRRINQGLSEIIRREGFNSLDEAVGCQVK
jgi:dihydroorotate dehydrogenase